MSVVQLHAHKWAGGDISLLPEYVDAGAVYRDQYGEPISELIPWLKEQGMNVMRVRLFVNPNDYNGPDKDNNACQDLDYIIPLCKEIVDSGMALMLDFHYSDTWADPANQWTPYQWKNLTDDELYVTIYSYTRETLSKLKANGIVPAFIQPGNEISYGMLWGGYGTPEADLKRVFMGSEDNWKRLGGLLYRAILACREECPDSKIIIHTERTATTSVQKNFYDHIDALKIDYDIIGLSYYPYFHGNLKQLNNSLSQLESNYPDKEIMIVETGYSYAWEVPGTEQIVDYPYSLEGQNIFATELVEMLDKHPNVTGLLWWWLEYNAYSTSLTNWYNAPLFDSRTGCATPALKTIASFATTGSNVNDKLIDERTSVMESMGNSDIYDINGLRLSSIPQNKPYIFNGKIEVRK